MAHLVEVQNNTVPVEEKLAGSTKIQVRFAF